MKAIVTALLVVTASAAHAQSIDPAGYWQGTIAILGTAALSGYDLAFSMGRTGGAKIDSPPVGRAVTKSLEGVWNGAHVTFETRGVQTSWAGELNAAGTELRGEFTQGGVSIPLTLTR